MKRTRNNKRGGGRMRRMRMRDRERKGRKENVEINKTQLSYNCLTYPQFKSECGKIHT